MALPLVSDINATTRAKLSDNGSTGAGTGEVYTDAVLLPFVNMAYRYAARYLRTKGMGLLRKQSVAIAVTIGQTALTRSPGAAPNFPADMLRPIALRERPTGGGVGTYTRMNSSDNFLPDRAAGPKLLLWDWRGDTIQFIGSTVNEDVQLQYEGDLAPLAGPSDTVLIPDGIDALACLTASFAAESRDEGENSEKLRQLGERDLDLIVAAELMLKKAAGAAWGPDN
jgi:hypothetical protein